MLSAKKSVLSGILRTRQKPCWHLIAVRIAEITGKYETIEARTGKGEDLNNAAGHSSKWHISCFPTVILTENLLLIANPFSHHGQIMNK